jgi:hypothetical protein
MHSPAQLCHGSDTPPAEPWVHIPPPEIVMNALSIFGGKNITQPEKGVFGLDEFSSALKRS